MEDHCLHKQAFLILCCRLHGHSAPELWQGQSCCHNKRFVNTDGKKWTMGKWVQAVQEGRTVP
eukprot:5562113-Karenia_brevis.AAC.1